MYKYLLQIFLALSFTATYSQLTITNGNHTLEISGSASSFYNYRSLKPGEVDNSKNRFKLRDAQISLDGRVGNTWEYAIKADFADMSANLTNAVIDPENPGLLETNVTYKGWKFLEINAGYGKLRFSRSQMVPFEFSAYWQGAELTRGSIFSTRDVGLTLFKNFYKQRANVYLGVYNGLGELSLGGDNDPSGNLEYVGRVDFSYPSKFKYRDFDEKHTPIPHFSVGLAARYMNKSLPAGTVFPDNATSSYGIKVIDGKRYVYGFDLAFEYSGFSAQFEMQQLKSQPQNPNDPLYQNLDANQTRGYFLSGGYTAQANYNFKKLNTLVSARFEELDLNDLVPGNSQRFSPAVAYQINGFNAMIKFQYFKILKEESIDPFSWKEQFRLGLQFQFK